MKLEPKHIIPYLDHKLKMKSDEGTMIYEAKGINMCEQFWILIKDKNGFDCQISNIKPILHPFDLTKEITHNGDKFVPIIELYPLFFRKPEHAEMICNQELDYAESHYYGGGALYVNTKHPLQNQYELMEKLFEWSIDVFGLIPQELAIGKS